MPNFPSAASRHLRFQTAPDERQKVPISQPQQDWDHSQDDWDQDEDEHFKPEDEADEAPRRLEEPPIHYLGPTCFQKKIEGWSLRCQRSRGCSDRPCVAVGQVEQSLG